MVFSNIQGGHAVLKTLKVITGNDPVCPGSFRIDGKPSHQGWAPYLPASSLAEGQKSSSCPGVLNTLAVITGDHPVRLGAGGLEGGHGYEPGTDLLTILRLTERQKSR
jgi:hypothetical protein